MEMLIRHIRAGEELVEEDLLLMATTSVDEHPEGDEILDPSTAEQREREHLDLCALKMLVYYSNFALRGAVLQQLERLERLEEEQDHFPSVSAVDLQGAGGNHFSGEEQEHQDSFEEDSSAGRLRVDSAASARSGDHRTDYSSKVLLSVVEPYELLDFFACAQRKLLDAELFEEDAGSSLSPVPVASSTAPPLRVTNTTLHACLLKAEALRKKSERLDLPAAQICERVVRRLRALKIAVRHNLDFACGLAYLRPADDGGQHSSDTGVLPPIELGVIEGSVSWYQWRSETVLWNQLIKQFPLEKRCAVLEKALKFAQACLEKEDLMVPSLTAGPAAPTSIFPVSGCVGVGNESTSGGGDHEDFERTGSVVGPLASVESSASEPVLRSELDRGTDILRRLRLEQQLPKLMVNAGAGASSPDLQQNMECNEKPPAMGLRQRVARLEETLAGLLFPLSEIVGLSQETIADRMRKLATSGFATTSAPRAVGAGDKTAGGEKPDLVNSQLVNKALALWRNDRNVFMSMERRMRRCLEREDSGAGAGGGALPIGGITPGSAPPIGGMIPPAAVAALPPSHPNTNSFSGSAPNSGVSQTTGDGNTFTPGVSPPDLVHTTPQDNRFSVFSTTISKHTELRGFVEQAISNGIYAVTK